MMEVEDPASLLDEEDESREDGESALQERVSPGRAPNNTFPLFSVLFLTHVQALGEEGSNIIRTFSWTGLD
jgi:hypothetical protein